MYVCSYVSILLLKDGPRGGDYTPRSKKHDVLIYVKTVDLPLMIKFKEEYPKISEPIVKLVCLHQEGKLYTAEGVKIKV